MAKRKVVYRTRKVVSRARRAGGSMFGGSMKPIIDGVGCGLLESFLGNTIPYGQPLIRTGFGMFRKNQTLTTLGALQLGQMLIGGGGSASNGVVR